MDFEKLLIFRIGHLGDALVALPAIWGIRKAFPSAHLALLSNADTDNPHYVSADKVLPEHGLIDEWITYPASGGKIASLPAMLKLMFELRRKRFEAVVYLTPRIRTLEQIDRDVRFFGFSGISKFIGIEYLKKTRLSATIPKPTPSVDAESVHLLKCLSFDGVPVNEIDLKPELLLTSGEVNFAKRWLRETIGFDAAKLKLIAVAPGSKWESKVWAEDRYAQVVSQLISKHGVFPIVFGGDEDREKGDRLLARWGTGANAAGKLNVREAAALIGECKIYLGNDTGTMHLAASVGTRCVAIFASTDWKGRWIPFGDGHRIFRQTVECEGCHTPNCFNGHKCLELTRSDAVYEACTRILELNSI